MKTLVIPFLAVLVLSGCTTAGAVASATTGTVASLDPAAMQAAEKALTAAHGLHEAASDALTAAANSKLCTGTCASTSKTYLDQSEAYLVAADKLVALGDATGIEAKISAATALISQIQSATGSK